MLCLVGGLGSFPGVQAATEARKIEEIVVTARKREESLQDTPVSVSSFSAEFARRFRLDRIEDVAKFTPGLQISDSGGQTGGSIFLRGIGSSSTNALIDQAVAINIDGVPVNSGHIVRATLLDVKKIDVLRGPQALFFGKNSPGGVISIRTADPGETFETRISTGYEFEADERFVRGMVSSPFGDAVGVRLTASYNEMDGYRELQGADVERVAFPPSPDTFPDSETLFARGTVVADPLSGLRIRGKFTYYDDERNRGGSGLQQRIACPNGAPQAIVPTDDCEADNTAYVGNLHPAVLAADPLYDPDHTEGVQDTSQQVASIDIEYRLGNGLSLNSVTGYVDLSEDEQGEFGAEPASKIMRSTVYGTEKLSEELRLTSSFNAPLNFMLGAYYETRDSKTATVAHLAPALGEALTGNFVPVPAGKQQLLQDQMAYSVFGQLMWDITRTLELSAGTRYSYEEKEVHVTSFGQPVNLVTDEDDWNNLSSQATLTWRTQDDLMLFVSYREGFKSGGLDGSFNPALAGPGPHELRYDEEVVDGFEGGIKSSWLNETLRLNASVFTYGYSDLQLGNFDPETTTLRILNVGQASIDGFELESQWLPAFLNGVTFRGAISVLSTQYDTFIGDCYTGQRPSQGCNLTPVNGAFTQQDLSGESLTAAPEVSGRLGARYERQLLGPWRVGVSLDGVYTGEYNGDTTHSPHTQQESYWKLNAGLRMFTADQRWNIALTGRNLTDQYTFMNAGDVPVTGSGTGTPEGIPADSLAVIQRGRALTLQLTYRPNVAR